MQKSILVTSFLLLVFSIFLSSCTLKNQIKGKILDKIDSKVQEEKAELTDEQILGELDSNDTSVDADLKTLDSELQ